MKISSNTTHLFAAALSMAMMTASVSWAGGGGSPPPPPAGGGGTSASATASGLGISSSGALSTATSKNSNRNSNRNTNVNANQNSSGANVGIGPNSTVNQGSNLSSGIPNVYAPALAAAGYEVCLGSMSVGGSGSGFGLSFGGTYEDKGCQARLNAKTLATLGYVVAGREVLCQDPSIRAAMHNAGTPCAGDVESVGSAGQCRQEFDIFNGWQQVCGP